MMHDWMTIGHARLNTKLTKASGVGDDLRDSDCYNVRDDPHSFV